MWSAHTLWEQEAGLGIADVGNEHAELRAPVPHMVDPVHRVSAVLQEVGQTVANDGGA